jgi:hypothetical protein
MHWQCKKKTTNEEWMEAKVRDASRKGRDARSSRSHEVTTRLNSLCNLSWLLKELKKKTAKKDVVDAQPRLSTQTTQQV